MHELPKPGGEERSDEPPRVAGYRVEGVLGRGASGVVYRARQLSVDRPIALKVLHPSATASERTVKRLRREARLMAMLDHPNIVTAVDFGKSSNRWWLAMELVEGQALSERLRRGGPLTEQELIELFVPLCNALQHAHEAGVIHRDVKPANILLTLTGAPKLVDLGLARADDEPQLTRVGATLGTPHYVSPEQARNPTSVDARSDVYSLAATMHHAVCGVPPFTGDSPAEVLANVLQGTLRSPHELGAGVSRGMALVLRKALSRDPSRRHASARELAADLKLIGAGRRPRVQRRRLEPVEGWEGLRSRVAAGVALLAIGVSFIAFRGMADVEPELAPIETQTRLGSLEDRWGSDELSLSEAYLLHSSIDPSPEERVRYERFSLKLDRDLESLLFRLCSEADSARRSSLSGERFDEARYAVGEGFSSTLVSSSGFEFEGLPESRLVMVSRWRERSLLEIEDAINAFHRDSLNALELWAEHELWPEARTLALEGKYDQAAALLAPDLLDQLEDAGVRTDSLDLERFAASKRLSVAEETLQGRRYELVRAWDELDEELLSSVRSACAEAEERLRGRDIVKVSDELRLWVAERFMERGLELESMPTRFTSRAANELALRVNELERLEVKVERERGLEAMARLDERSQELLSERRYAQLVNWWSEERQVASAEVAEFINLRISEARLLADLLRDAEATVTAGVSEEITFWEGGLVFKSRVRLEGDPVYEKFWVSPALGVERAWRLGGPVDERAGVRRVTATSLERLARRQQPCLEGGFLRLHEGDFVGADECYRALDSGEASTLLGDELSERLGPLLAAEIESDSERREWAERWVDSPRKLERLSEGSASKSLRHINAFLRDYGPLLDEERRAQVYRWREVLERASTPSTLQDFERVFGADSTRFPRRGRVELTQRFDEAREGRWTVGEWLALGVGWQAPRLARAEGLSSVAAPTLLLQDPIDLEAGPVETTFELQVPADSRGRLVVVSALGFHAAFVMGEADTGLVVAGSRDLVAVIGRALEGEGEEFAGLHPGEIHTVTMRANLARGTLTLLFDGEQCARIEDLSPKDQARSTSISLRSLEPLILLSAKVEAGRR